MTKTLYVTDLDGTLLDSSGSLPREVAARLDLLVRGGLLFSYATARSPGRARSVVGPGWGVPAVVYNGAFTVDPDAGTVLRRHGLDAEVVVEVLGAAWESGMSPLVFDLVDVERVQWVRDELTPGVERFVADRPGDARLDPRLGRADLRCDAVFYVAMIGTRQQVERTALALDSLDPACTRNLQQDTYHPQDWWLEVTPPGINKASEVMALRERVGADRLVVFGDNHNDLELFAVADESYAVANAAPAVRAAATDVIASNDAAGVLLALEARA